jgi:hypothetical protein
VSSGSKHAVMLIAHFAAETSDERVTWMRILNRPVTTRHTRRPVAPIPTAPSAPTSRSVPSDATADIQRQEPSAPTFIENGATSSSPSEYASSAVGSELSMGVQRQECAICMDARRDAICVPCGHVAGCHPCLMRHVESAHVCPICRAQVHMVVKIYEC